MKKIKFILNFFVVYPEHVGGNYGNAARLHFAQLSMPLLFMCT